MLFLVAVIFAVGTVLGHWFGASFYPWIFVLVLVIASCELIFSAEDRLRRLNSGRRKF